MTRNRLALHWQILIAMLLAAAIGIGLNAGAGGRQLAQPIEIKPGSIQKVGMKAPVAVPAGRFWSLDSSQRTLIQFDEVVDKAGPGATYRTRRWAIGPEQDVDDLAQELGEPWPELPPQAADAPAPRRHAPTIKQLAALDGPAYALFAAEGRSLARATGDYAQLIGDLFLRMLKMVSVPLIIVSLVSGVVGLGHAESLGRMFGRTMLYYASTSLIAICVGLAMVNIIRPGVGRALQAVEAVEAPQGQSLAAVLYEQLLALIPENPFAAAAQGQFLSIIAFSLLFGVCTILVGGKSAERIRELIDAAFEVMMKITMLIIALAPFGVFFLMLSATATEGSAIFGSLGWYMLTVALALGFHAGVVLPAILKFVAKRNPREFAQAMSPALFTAFSSASSNGTLPLTLNCVEQRAGVSNRVGAFVLPLGATINMDGTALYEAVAVLFIAQMTGHDLSLAQQAIVALTALLASIGAAGIPHAGLVMMVIILQAVGLPAESQGLIIAVDRVLDMARTMVNVWSDSCGCAVIARFEEAPRPA
ncbi:MAG: dicarboxylate/amino acid:cation symporter [Pirellulales bacterium]|nr:dicarboxylate/amino acid:cation symporter [Pirellulales bacterium]